jgi:hypothetical protein
MKPKDEQKLRFQELRREIAIGVDQLDWGESTTYASVQALADEVKAEGRRQRAARQKTQP